MKKTSSTSNLGAGPSEFGASPSILSQKGAGSKHGNAKHVGFETELARSAESNTVLALHADDDDAGQQQRADADQQQRADEEKRADEFGHQGTVSSQADEYGQKGSEAKIGISKTNTFGARASRLSRAFMSIGHTASKASTLSGKFSLVRTKTALQKALQSSPTFANERSAMRIRMDCVSDSQAFRTFICFLILCDVVLHLYDVQERNQKESSPELVGTILKYLLGCFILLSMVEVYNICSTRCCGKERGPGTKTRVYDICLVFLSLTGALLYDVHSTLATVPRFLRIARPILETRRTKCLRPLHVFLCCCVSASGFLVSGLIIYTAEMLVSTFLAMQVLQPQIEGQYDEISNRFGADAFDDSVKAFSSIPSSIATLFALSMGGAWQEVGIPIVSSVHWALVFFAGHGLCTIAIIAGSSYMALFEAQRIFRLNHGTLRLHTHQTDRSRSESQWRSVFKAMNTNKDGFLTWRELLHNGKTNKQFQSTLEILDVGDQELHQVWKLLDKFDRGSVNEQEFVEVMWRLRDESNSTMLIAAQNQTKQLRDAVNQLTTGMAELKTDNAQLIGDLRTEIARIQLSLSMQSSKSNYDQFGLNGNQSDNSKTVQFLSMRKSLTDSSTFHKKANDAPMLQQPASSDGTKNRVNFSDGEKGNQGLSRCGSSGGLLEAVQYMRSVPAEAVAQYGRTEVPIFWTAPVEHLTESTANCKKWYGMSMECTYCDFFVSHCWQAPKDWFSYFNLNVVHEEYGYIKALELYHVLKSAKIESNPSLTKERTESLTVKYDNMHRIDRMTHLAAGNSLQKNTKKKGFKSLEDLTLWVDKCCIPQGDEQAKLACIGFIEEYLLYSNGLIVLLSWNYFSRLWCVYEWACFLRLHHPLRVEIGCDAFLKDSPQETLPLFLKSIKNLSVKGAQCFHADDRKILQDKVFKYYKGDDKEASFDSFERFAKCAAIAFVAKEIVWWRGRNSLVEESGWLNPLRGLAFELGYSDLYNLLISATPASWFAQCNQDQTSFERIVDVWFKDMIVEYLLFERKRAVREEFIITESGTASAQLMEKSDLKMFRGSMKSIGRDSTKSNDSNDKDTKDTSVSFSEEPIQGDSVDSDDRTSGRPDGAGAAVKRLSLAHAQLFKISEERDNTEEREQAEKELSRASKQRSVI